MGAKSSFFFSRATCPGKDFVKIIFSRRGQGNSLGRVFDGFSFLRRQSSMGTIMEKVFLGWYDFLQLSRGGSVTVGSGLREHFFPGLIYPKSNFLGSSFNGGSFPWAIHDFKSTLIIQNLKNLVGTCFVFKNN